MGGSDTSVRVRSRPVVTASCAAQALVSHTQLDAERIAKEAMAIAAGVCVYTNTHLTCLQIGAP